VIWCGRVRHGRIFDGRKHWILAYLRWLSGQKFAHPAQQIVFQEALDAIDDAAARLRRLDEQLSLRLSRAGRWRRWSPPIRRCAASPPSLR
jgi:hypothetical protein